MKRIFYLFFLQLCIRVTLSQTESMDSLKSIVHIRKPDTNLLKAACRLAIENSENYPDQVKALIHKVIGKSDDLHFYYGIAKGFNIKGICYDVSSQYDSAIACYQKSYSMANKYNLVTVEASALNNLGLVYWNIGNYESAIQNYFLALKQFERTRSDNNIANVCNNIGLVYSDMKNHDQAIIYFFKAAALYRKNNDQHGLGSCYTNLSLAYTAKRQAVMADRYLDTSINIKRSIQDRYGLAISLLHRSDIFIDNRQFKEAKQALREAELILEKIGNKNVLLAVYNAMATVFKRDQNNTEALNYYLKMLRISREIGSIRKEAVALSNLALIYSEFKDFKRAYYFSELSRALHDSILNIENYESVNNTKEKYETEKKEAENKLLQQQNNIKTLENEASRQTIFLLVAAIAVATTIVLWQVSVARVKKQKRALEVEKKMQQDRERISRDLHDNVGGQLSYVLFSLEADEEPTREARYEKAHTLGNALRGVTGNLRETIWALNQEKLTLQDISDKLKVYTRNMFAYTATKIKFQEQIRQEAPLEPVFALHLFRICQEIINNVFKHAQASELLIEISNQETTRISITDNGVGFVANEEQDAGYGLAGLKSRAGEIKARLYVHTELNKGTHVTLIV